ncbi:MAG: hypothetical protein HUK22_08530, partial [Thermoguttaceae bacterium]|nr:hypothetical protein [Thermoguttaceae bacterium]
YADGVAIPGADSDEYEISLADVGKTISVVAEGYGVVAGKVEAAAEQVVPLVELNEVVITYEGTLDVGTVLTATITEPQGAPANFTWLRVTDGGATMRQVGTGSTYTITAADAGAYISVEATGSSPYAGTVVAEQVGPVPGEPEETAPAAPSDFRISSFGFVPERSAWVPTFVWTDNADNETAYHLTVSNVTTGQTRTVDLAANRTYFNSFGIATFTDDYRFEVWCDNALGASEKQTIDFNVSRDVISDLTVSPSAPFCGGEVVATVYGLAEDVDPEVVYQWYRVDLNGEEIKIDGATGASYAPQLDDVGYALEVVVSGANPAFKQLAYAMTTSAVTEEEMPTITSVTLSTTAPKVGETITAIVSPEGATAEFAWYRIDITGEAIPIEGATGASYVVDFADVGYYLGVDAFCVDEYVGAQVAMSEQAVETETPLIELESVTLSTTSPKVGETIMATVSPE